MYFISKNRFILILPVIGILGFILFYFIASLYYPGGNQSDPGATGFSWQHNYWCNLFNDQAINGKLNNAKPFAVIAMLCLSVSLGLFWLMAPLFFGFSRPVTFLLQGMGLVSILCASMIYSGAHDVWLNIATGIAGIPLLGVLTGLFKRKWFFFFVTGLLHTGLIGINNLFYYSGSLIRYLPVVQKISFIIFLLWIVLLCRKFYRFIPQTLPV
jgi:hypothetical protein